ncbi:uncharacterized protein LOC141713413 [Apium graveolens]|uniref:uncharacterized protein LOC141713413 n=1 Tax=Apium graveolens TaxID=4045 RepID=UPI003D79D430
MRDSRNQFMGARSNLVRGRTIAREAEALSLKEALSWTKERAVTKCIFESDAKLLVDAIHGFKGRSMFDTIVENCSEILKHFEEVLVVFAHRSANTVAHLLAQVAYSMTGLRE